VDVSQPLNPRQVGCFGTDGYVHDAQCLIYRGPDTRYSNREVCFCFNENSLTLVDVQNKNSMSIISKEVYVGYAYTHQGWLHGNFRTLLLDDEQDEQGKPTNQQFTKTYVWDVTNLQSPQLRSVFEASVRAIDHNQYIVGDLSYQANYESGLRVVRINTSTHTLSTVGYFDAYPTRTTTAFNGLWSVYPYFRSGNVALSSINHGLFMVKPNIAAMDALYENQTYAEQTRTRPVIESMQGAYCPALTETRQCDAPVFC